MTQKDFDCRFDKIFKVGFSLVAAGIALAIAVGLPSFYFDVAWPFLAAMALTIFGSVICLADFTHDIFCNPRWKKRRLDRRNLDYSTLASAMSAGTAETPKEAQGEARQRGGEAETPNG